MILQKTVVSVMNKDPCEHYLLGSYTSVHDVKRGYCGEHLCILQGDKVNRLGLIKE